MISDLSTFIQYFAALYFTICIDTIVTRRFWSPNYYQQVTTTIGSYKFKQSTNIKKKIDDKVKQKADSLRDQATKRGVFMLLVCVAVMLFAGFEECFNNSIGYAAYTYVILLYCVFTIFSRTLLRRWFWTILLFIVPIILFYTCNSVLTTIFPEHLSLETHLPGWVLIGNYAKALTCLLLIVPILHQLFINWLYSNAYLRHIHCELKKEYERYDKTNQAIEKGDNSLADPVYNGIFAKQFFSKDGKDIVITEYNEAVVNRIIDACEPPKARVMIVSYWKNRKMELPPPPPQEDNDFNDEEVVIPKTPELTEQELKRAYEEYEKLQGKKIVDFCNENNIPIELFQGYRKKKKKK